MERGLLHDLVVPHIDRSSKPIETWADVWAKAQTGDVLLVSGARDLDSQMAKSIKAATRSYFSHVGLLVREPSDAMWNTYGRLRGDLGDNPACEAGPWGEGEDVPKDRQIYMFDSDFEEDGTVDGPVLRPLQEVLKAYLADDYHGTDADIVVRRLEVDESRRPEFQASLEQFADSVAGRCFEAKSMMDGAFVQMLLSVWGGNPSEDLTKLFCSEVASACYQSMGLIESTENATNYQPEHFAESKMVDLLGGARLGPEVVVDVNEFLYEISVSVSSAKDVYLPRSWGQMDPYCKIKIAGRKRCQTEAVNNTTTPEWNFEANLMYDGVSPLEFELWDKNMFDDGYVGKGSLESGDFVKKGYKGSLAIVQDDSDTDATLKVQVQIVRRGCGPYCTTGKQEEDEGKDDKRRKKSKHKKEKRDKKSDDDRKEKKKKKDKKEKSKDDKDDEDEKKHKKDKHDKKDKKEKKDKGGYPDDD